MVFGSIMSFFFLLLAEVPNLFFFFKEPIKASFAVVFFWNQFIQQWRFWPASASIQPCLRPLFGGYKPPLFLPLPQCHHCVHKTSENDPKKGHKKLQIPQMWQVSSKHIRIRRGMRSGGRFQKFLSTIRDKRANSWILLYKFLLFHSHFPLLNHFP